MPRKKSSQYCRKFQTKNTKEHLYGTLFPSYQSSYKYHVYFINNATSLEEIDYLLHVVETTSAFIIDTESAYKSNTPALIQLYFLQASHMESPLLLVEIQHLPHQSSELFYKFKKLFQVIFNSKSHLYSWGSLTTELSNFSSCQLFTFPLHVITHDLQGQFKGWFNKWIDSYYGSSITDNNTTSDDIVIIDAPSHDPTLLLPTHTMNKKKINSNDSWSLQDAVLYTVGQYLSKRDTLRQWAIGLDVQLSTHDPSFSFQYRQKLITYACLDCVSVAHLNLIMQQSEIPLDLKFVQDQIILGEYKISQTINVASDKFQIDDESSSSSIEQSDVLVVTVHDRNDRHQPMPQVTSIDSERILSISSTDLSPDDPTVSTPIPTTQTIPRKRSLNAKRRRNHKSSVRHRKNRYKHEIIRPANMTIASIKQLLRENYIKYLNIHVVRSTLYIGVKSAVHKQLYERIISANMFV